MRPVTLSGYAMQSALGNAGSSLRALQLGHSGFKAHPRWVEQYGEPMVLACDPELDPFAPLEQRLLHMSLAALATLLDSLPPDPPLRLFLALPEPQAGLEEQTLRRFLDELAEASTARAWPIEAIAPVAGGRDAGLRALQRGAEYLNAGHARACLAGAVDSWVDPYRLQVLDAHGQLHSVRQRRGFIPGEGAGLCRLESAADPRHAELLGIAQAPSSFRPYSDDTPNGQALSAACRAVLALLPQEKQLREVHADLNGERWRATEYGFASLRLAPWLERTDRFRQTATAFGDTGVATGPIQLALALAAARHGYAEGEHALLWTAGAGGECAAALLRAPRHTARLKTVDPAR